MKTLKAQMPAWADCLFQRHRYTVFHGGRSSGKSWTVAQYLVLEAMKRRGFFLCAREIQRSIKDSAKRVIARMIERIGAEAEFEILEHTIRNRRTGSEFIFRGLRDDAVSIKSTEGITHAWIEEAHTMSAESFHNLDPTVREPGSQLLFTFNPKHETDPVYQIFVAGTPPPDSAVRKINFYNNPWFPEESRRRMEWDRERDPDRYRHIWEGEPVQHTNAQVFAGRWRIGHCPEPPPKTLLHHGADWGFAGDPTVILRCWMDGKTLYIDRARFGYHVETDSLPALFDLVETARAWPIIADSSRPETIRHMRRHGYPKITPSKKGPGSIEDGIEFLRGFDIVVAPDLKDMVDELSLYRYKTDKRIVDENGDPIVLPIIEDKNNDGIDALRYAVEPVMRGGRPKFIIGSS